MKPVFVERPVWANGERPMNRIWIRQRAFEVGPGDRQLEGRTGGCGEPTKQNTSEIMKQQVKQQSQDEQKVFESLIANCCFAQLEKEWLATTNVFRLM